MNKGGRPKDQEASDELSRKMLRIRRDTGLTYQKIGFIYGLSQTRVFERIQRAMRWERENA